MTEIAPILLAEDDENDVLLMKRAFARAKLSNQLQVVKDGEEALCYLQATGDYANREKYPFPCLLLLDLKMPKKNGFEVLTWIRQQQSIRRLIVVILTASNQIPDINHGYDLGVNSYLVKPPDLDTLTEMLKTVHAYWVQLNQLPEVQPNSVACEN